MRDLRRLHTVQALMLSFILLASFALRVYGLDAQSLWSDEGISLQRSVQPLAQLLATMPVEQLPGYFVLLHFWLQVAGDHDFALRFFSVWPSVLAIAVAYRLAADLGNWRAGAIGALLLAVNPFQISYAQEVRTYSWLMAGGMLSTWCFWRVMTAHPTLTLPRAAEFGAAALRRRGRELIRDGRRHELRPGTTPLPNLGRGWGWGTLAGYVLTTTLTIYLHFYGFLVPFAQAVFLISWLIVRRDWRVAANWAAATALIALLFLPWLPRALQIFSFTGWREPLDPWQIPWRYLTAYTVGDTIPEPWQQWLPWLYLALIVIGCIAWWRRQRSASLFLLCQALAPLLAVFALALRQPDAHERYTIFIAGPLLLLAAGGLAFVERSGEKSEIERLRDWRWVKSLNLSISQFPLRIGQVISAFMLGGLVIASTAALLDYHSNPAFQKPDYRAAALAIQQAEQPGDVILVDGPNPELVLLHYYKGALPIHDLRFLREADSDKIEETLTELTAGANRAWEVLFFHAPGPIQLWLATQGWTAPPTEYNGIRVTLYGLPEAEQPSAQQRLDIAFAPALLLEQAAVTPTITFAGQLVRVTTQWQVLQPAPDYKFSLRLADSNDQIVQAQDYIPQNWFTPTSAWPVGESTMDRRGIWLPPDLAVGHYRVTLRLYDPANGVAVETAVGQDVLLGEIDVSHPAGG